MATPVLSEFKTLRQFQQTFRTESDCIRFLESKLWENGIPVSPFVPSSKVYNRRMIYIVVAKMVRTSISGKVHLGMAPRFLYWIGLPLSSFPFPINKE